MLLFQGPILKFPQNKIYILLLLCSISLYSCAAKNTNKLLTDLKEKKYDFFLQTSSATYRTVQKMGEGSMYYVGLHLKQAGYIETACLYFLNGIKVYGEPFKNLCRLALYDIAPSAECLNCITERLQELSISNTAENNNETHLLNQLTLQHLILLQQYEKLNQDYKTWYQTVSLTPQIVNSLKKLSNELPDFVRLMIEIRIAVFEKNYVFAWKKIQEAFSLKYTCTDIAFPSLLSDIGKAGLYGAGDRQAGKFFETLMETSLNSKYQAKGSHEQIQLICFYAAFYAARIYARIGKPLLEKAITLFVKATEYAPSDADFDAALWYYLNTLKKISFSRYEKALITTAPLWKKPQWYGDLIQDLKLLFLSNKNWNNMNSLYKIIQKTDLPTHRISVAYILARSGFFSHNNAQTILQEISNTPSSPLYYRILATYHLRKKISLKIYPVKTKKQEPAISPTNVHVLLDGLIHFGLLPMLYKHATQFSTALNVEKIFHIAQILADNGLYDDSIRMMTLIQNTDPLKKEQLYLLYPRPWLPIIKKYAEEYRLPEYFVYALIRSESLFNTKAISQAGAVGLMQLMPSTAADIAKNLKITNYDLTDPVLNIRFGVHYIAEMIRRSHNQILPACFAYNAGISRVRIWQKENKNLSSNDLFLESVAYGETREYGKQIFITALLYAYLYYEKHPEDIIKEFFPHF